ncbi:MAG: efflux RND transporter periplasmic adaptor subunit [Calditrichota bacterium]
MMKKTLLPILIAGLLLTFLIQCSGKSAGEEAASEEIIPVETYPVHENKMQKTLDLLGDVKGDQEVRVYSKVSDRIVRFAVDMGDRVQEGSLIAVIENSSIQARVNQVQANLEQAQSQLANLENEFNRMEQLLKENAVSQQQYDATKTQLEATRAQVRGLQEGLKQTKTQLSDSYIRSPLNGLIGQKFLEQGDMVGPQSPVVTVVKMDTVKVLVDVIERNAPEIHIGLPADIRVNALPDTAFRGTVSRVSPVINPNSRMLETEIRIPNSDRLLRPGMYAEVSLIMETKDNALVIPKYAILQKTEMVRDQLGQQQVEKHSYVYVVQDDRAWSRQIETGIEQEGLVEVLSGLQPDEPVVLMGQQNLQDSTRVKVVQRGGAI